VIGKIKLLIKKILNYFIFTFKNKKLKGFFFDKNEIVDFRLSNSFEEVDEILFSENNKTYPNIFKDIYYIENNSLNVFSKNIDNLFRENHKWSNLLFSNLKFIIIYSENNIIPFTIRNSNPYVKTIYIASSDKDIEFINKYFESIDFLIYNEPLISKELLNSQFKNLTPFDNDEEILKIIKEIKERNIDTKFYSTTDITENIENILSKNSQLDGVIKLNNLTFSSSNSFDEYLNKFTNSVDSFHIKNNIYFEYKNIISDKKKFFKRSLKEGVRFECITN